MEEKDFEAIKTNLLKSTPNDISALERIKEVINKPFKSIIQEKIDKIKHQMELQLEYNRGWSKGYDSGYLGGVQDN